ncbi:MAG: cysteine desulfurase family protein [Pirellulales bacterium]|nr:cysteine desulfurase family protein [Pirellulales bacterium]
MDLPIYLDNHATTRLDPRVLAAMLPYLAGQVGNAGSTTHDYGRNARAAVDASRESIAQILNCDPAEIVFTSGATESNNLAIFGAARRTRRPGNHLISVATEHRAVLDPLAALTRDGYEPTLLDVAPAGHARAGMLDLATLAAAIRPTTCLISVMLANNEIGVIQPIREIAAICQEHGIPLHCDATQAVGKIPVDVRELGVDLLSFSGHKIYGPLGIGALFVRQTASGGKRLRLLPQIYGGGQEQGLRSGTLNVPGIVGLATALKLCEAEMANEIPRLAALRGQLWRGIQQIFPAAILNGPDIELDGVPGLASLSSPVSHLSSPASPSGATTGLTSSATIPGAANQMNVAPGLAPHPLPSPPAPPLPCSVASLPSPVSLLPSPLTRLPGNLNVQFPGLAGEALILQMPEIAISSGSACTSAEPRPSHVLAALGLSPEAVHASLRFGLGRFNSAEDIELAVKSLKKGVQKLQALQ